MGDFLNLFVTPPGNMLYFLVVIGVSQAALLVALEQRFRSKEDDAADRYSLAALGVVLAWVALAIGAIVGLVADQPTDAILPPLEHAINAVVILLVTWAFLTAEAPQRKRLWDLVLILFVALIVAGTLYTLVQWQDLADLVDFNGTEYALTWVFVGFVLSALGIILHGLRFKVVDNAPLKIVYYVLLLAGYSSTLLSIADGSLLGHYVGTIRGVFLLAMPIFTFVVYRHVMVRLVSTSVASGGAPSSERLPLPVDQPPAVAAAPRPPVAAPSGPMERESAQLLRALGDMLQSTDPTEIPHHITTAIASTLKADIVALGKIKDADWVDLIAAYDNIQQDTIQGMSINLDEQPTMVTAIERFRQRSLFPDRNIDELVDLYTRLDISSSSPLGPAYLQPMRRDGQTFAILIIMFPYTGRELRTGETTLLEGLAPMASRLLAISEHSTAAPVPPVVIAQPAPDLETVSGEIDLSAALQAREEMHRSLELAYSQIGQLTNVIRDLKIEMEYERNRLAEILATDEETMSISQQILALNEESSEIEAQRNHLANELQEARTTLAGATAEDKPELYQSMIDMLNREQESLEAQKTVLEQQISTLREQTNDMFLVPASIQSTLQTLNEDKTRLLNERDAISAELQDVQSELELLGVEGGVAGLALVLGQLYEERDQLRSQVSMAASNVLATKARTEHAEQFAVLQQEIERIATDREAAIKQRDALRQEQDAWQKERTEWQTQRQRLGQQIVSIQKEINEQQARREGIIEERNELIEERTRWHQERDRLIADKLTLQNERDQLMARIEGNRELLEQLGADGVGTLKTMIDALTEERSNLEHQLHQAQAKLDQMESKLQALEHKAIRQPEPAQPRQESPAVILSLAQELRTPMSSITGYTDLLLGESVGILGALQRKFLQRVKANIDRLGSLVEDLVSVTALDSGQVSLIPEAVNIIEILDDAITNAGTQFREKGITLNLDIDESVPSIQVDRDAVQQVVTQLLGNAYLVSPTDGEVSITARQTPVIYTDAADYQTERNSLYVAIQDQGGGIPLEDQERVFTRLYRADNPLIQGVGDTGVGLSIARALVEAHSGRIWVESELGTGSRFVFVIPFAS